MKRLTILVCCILIYRVCLSQTTLPAETRLWGGFYHPYNPDNGGIFSMQADGYDITIEKLFPYNLNGSTPIGKLVKIPTGEFIGICQQGGSNGIGVIYKLSSDGSTRTKLYDFSGVNGTAPRANLIFASNGFLYGTRGNGNAEDIFRISPDGTEYHVVRSSIPRLTPGSLFEASDNKLYWTSTNYTSLNALYSMDLDGAMYAAYQIDNYNSQKAFVGNIIEDNASNLYLMRFGRESFSTLIWTVDIIKVNKDGTNFQSVGATNLYEVSLDNRNPDLSPHATATMVRLNNGTMVVVATCFTNYHSKLLTSQGGIFSAVKDLVQTMDLFASRTGKLFGIDRPTFPNVDKTRLFSITPDGSGFVTLSELPTLLYMNRFAPQKMIETTDENFLIVSDGGRSGTGGILNVNATEGWSMNQLFCPPEGSHPDQQLLLASDGYLYGTTAAGGEHDLGTLFRIDTKDRSFTKLYDFAETSCSTKLVERTGILFGAGEKNIFTINLDGSDFRILYTFPDSIVTSGNLIVENGFIYGTFHNSLYSLEDHSKIFRMKEDGGDYTIILESFKTIGSWISDIMMGMDKKIYGVTVVGGANANGTLFSLNADGTGLLKLMDNKSYTFLPTQAADGNLYGVTDFGQSFYFIRPDGSGHGTLQLYNPLLNNGFLELPGGKLILTGLFGIHTFDFSKGLPNITYTEEGTVSPLFLHAALAASIKIDLPSLIVAIEEEHSGEEILLYPNPVKNYLQVSLNNFTSTKVIRLNILDALGREIQTENVLPTKEIGIDIQDLKPGSYVLEMCIDKRAVYKRFIVK